MTGNDAKTDKVDPGYPVPIAGNWPGFPPAFAAGVSAGVMWNNGKAYYFKGNQYLRYDVAADKVDPGYPLPIAGQWPGLWPDNIDAGVVWPNGKAYFFKGSQYTRYDIAADKADAGYPLPIRATAGLSGVSRRVSMPRSVEQREGLLLQGQRVSVTMSLPTRPTPVTRPITETGPTLPRYPCLIPESVAQ
jgi:hypothetical protein